MVFGIIYSLQPVSRGENSTNNADVACSPGDPWQHLAGLCGEEVPRWKVQGPLFSAVQISLSSPPVFYFNYCYCPPREVSSWNTFLLSMHISLHPSFFPLEKLFLCTLYRAELCQRGWDGNQLCGGHLVWHSRLWILNSGLLQILACFLSSQVISLSLNILICETGVTAVHPLLSCPL